MPTLGKTGIGVCQPKPYPGLKTYPTDELYRMEAYPVLPQVSPQGKKRVRASDLKFPLDSHAPDCTSWFTRWVARRTAAMILNSPAETYQFGGWTGALCLKYELVDARKEQLAHWILRMAGYLLCPADLMKLTGCDEPNQQKQPASSTK